MTDVADEGLDAAIESLARALEATGRPHMIIGGIAVLARGVVRDTDDVDATVWAPDLDVSSLVAHLGRAGIVGRIDDFEAFARISQVLLLIHEPSGTPIEVSLAWLPFEEEAIAAADRLRIGTARVPVARAEDLIIYKVIAGRPRDLDDVERLLVRHAGGVDMSRVREIIAQLGAALDDPGPSQRLEALLASTSA